MPKFFHKKIKGGQMSKGRDRTVSKQEASNDARTMLQNSGGGELIIKGKDGKIRSKDTIPPGNDPNPPKDKEH
jgi:hypothetical protein